MLRMPGRKTHEYARYSPPLAFLSLFSIHGCCDHMLENRSKRSLVPTSTWISPTARSWSEVPRKEASPFRSCCHVCASLLKAFLVLCVCTQILLLPLTLCPRADVFEPSWPLACNIKLVLFSFIELCCDIPTWQPDLDHVPCVYV